MIRKKEIFMFCLLLIAAPLIVEGQSQHVETHIQSQIENEDLNQFIPCRLKYNLLLKENWSLLDPNLKSSLQKPLFDPPQLQDSVRSPGGNFILHFDRSGGDAVPLADLEQNGIPDYIDSAAVILDYVWYMEVDILQFQAPLNGEGNMLETYHVYFQNLSSELGITHSQQEIPGPEGYYRYTSYMILDNDYQNSNFPTKGLDALRVTAAHEFNHAIQLSTRVWWQDGVPRDIFLMEMTSSWLEDVLYDEINDYLNDLPYFFSTYSNTSFTNADYLYPYGNSLFMHMLENQFGDEIGVDIWERIKQKPAIEALSEVLNEENTSLVDQLHQYAIWLYYTGERAEPEIYFPEGHLYPQLSVKQEDVYQHQVEFSQQLSTNPYATRVMQIKDLPPGEYQTVAKSTKFPGFLTQIVSPSILNTISFNENGFIQKMNTDPLDVLLTNSSGHQSEQVYLVGSGLNIPSTVLAYPNPVIVSEQEEMAFTNIPEAGNIHIFNSNGEKIV
jgi:hypothetical protein